MHEGLRQFLGLRKYEIDGRGFVYHGTYLSGLVLGIFLGVIMAFIIFSLLFDKSDLVSSSVIDFSTIGATLFASLIAFLGVNLSLQHAMQGEARIWNRKLSAAKSVLPLALDSIYEIASRRIVDLAIGAKQSNPDFRLLESAEIEIIKQCIEASDGLVQTTLIELVQAYQLASARFAEREHEGRPLDQETGYAKSERIYAMVDWFAIKGLCDVLYGFSRGEQNTVDRQYAVERASLHMYTASIDGFALENDPEYLRIRKLLGQTGDFSFARPNWRRQKRVL